MVFCTDLFEGPPLQWSLFIMVSGEMPFGVFRFSNKPLGIPCKVCAQGALALSSRIIRKGILASLRGEHALTLFWKTNHQATPNLFAICYYFKNIMLSNR